MSDINQCTFTGRLGADPEFKSFQNGGRICNMRMAVGEQWKDRDGNKKERTEWVSVAITNEGLVGVAERFLRKGSRIAITGQFRTRKWQDQNGNDRYSTEIVLPPFHGTLVMLDSAGDKSGGTQSRTDAKQGANAQGGWGDDLDDDIRILTDDPPLPLKAPIAGGPHAIGRSRPSFWTSLPRAAGVRSWPCAGNDGDGEAAA